jgi:hypothetical protein
VAGLRASSSDTREQSRPLDHLEDAGDQPAPKVRPVIEAQLLGVTTDYVYVAVPAATLIAALGLAGYAVKKKSAKSGKN